MQPHKIKYWMHCPEKDEDPESYGAKVTEICGLYQEAPSLEESGTHVISTDEMTGIQALEFKYPLRFPIPGQPMKIEFEYIRHGTISMIGFFNVATGKFFNPYLNETRKEKDFHQAVRQVIATDPSAKWIFILDGLNIHMSETLVRYVNEACGLNLDLGEKGKSGILKNKGSRAEFLHDPGHRIRFVYTPKHCSWLNQIELCFGIINKRLLKRTSYKSKEDLKRSIRRFWEQRNLTAHPFKWTYQGKVLSI